MKSLKTLISNVLDNNESLCLDSSEDKNTLLDSIMDALDLDDKTVVSMLIAEGADVQLDNDGQFIVFTNVFQEDQMYAVTFIIFAYGLYVAVEMVRRTQLLCEKHTQAISTISGSNNYLLYFCTLSRVMLWDVLKWDRVG